MQPNVGKIRELMLARNWTASELARHMGVSRSEVTRILNGSRKGGRKIIGGLIKAFPDETVESLFFLQNMYPNVNINSSCVTYKKFSSTQGFTPVRHPKAHQLACRVNEDDGLVEIKQGKCVTTLVLPPGPIDIEFSIDNGN